MRLTATILLLITLSCSSLDRTWYQDDPSPETACLAPADFDPGTVGLHNTHVDDDGLLTVDGAVDDVDGGLAYGVLLVNGRCVQIYVPWYGTGAKWLRFNPDNPTHVAYTRRYYGIDQ